MPVHIGPISQNFGCFPLEVICHKNMPFFKLAHPMTENVNHIEKLLSYEPNKFIQLHQICNLSSSTRSSHLVTLQLFCWYSITANIWTQITLSHKNSKDNFHTKLSHITISLSHLSLSFSDITNWHNKFWLNLGRFGLILDVWRRRKRRRRKGKRRSNLKFAKTS